MTDLGKQRWTTVSLGLITVIVGALFTYYLNLKSLNASELNEDLKNKVDITTYQDDIKELKGVDAEIKESIKDIEDEVIERDQALKDHIDTRFDDMQILIIELSK